MFALHPVSSSDLAPVPENGREKENRNEHPYLSQARFKTASAETANSADVMVGFWNFTHSHITTFVLNCNTRRHQINQKVALTVKFWRLAVGHSSLFLKTFPTPGAGAWKFVFGPSGCVIMDIPYRILSNDNERRIDEREIAGNHVGIVCPGSKPASADPAQAFGDRCSAVEMFLLTTRRITR